MASHCTLPILDNSRPIKYYSTVKILLMKYNSDTNSGNLYTNIILIGALNSYRRRCCDALQGFKAFAVASHCTLPILDNSRSIKYYSTVKILLMKYNSDTNSGNLDTNIILIGALNSYRRRARA